jgi:hypothetical protein
MMRAPSLGIVSLVAVGCLGLGVPRAFAGTCSSFTQSELPNGGLPAPGGGLPSGDTFLTAATGVTPLGSLNGTSGTGYPTCTSGGTNFIPFFLAGAASVSITVVEDDPSHSPTDTYFELTVNGVSYTQSPPGTGGDTLLDLGLSGGIGTLGITDLLQQANGTPATDQISVSMQFNNYIPEPTTLALLGFGAVGVIGLRRRSRVA